MELSMTVPGQEMKGEPRNALQLAMQETQGRATSRDDYIAAPSCSWPIQDGPESIGGLELMFPLARS